MKRILSIALLAGFSSLALAGGKHAGGHGHGGHDSMAGKPGDSKAASRTVEVVMDDSMRFTPSKIDVKAGETVRFFVKNAGKIPHEMVIGTMAELKEHAEMMRKMPDMRHDDPNSITLKPGQRGGLVWQFDEAGTVDFACLLPGHMEAGMVGKVIVQ